MEQVADRDSRGSFMSTQEAHPRTDTGDDITLVHAAKEGDMAAFEQLVKRHTATIFRVAMHIVSAREDAEEVVQDAFLKAFQHLQDFEERARFLTWLTKIAVNVALMKLRSSRRATIISIDEEADEGGALRDRLPDWQPNPEQLYSSGELGKILRRGLAFLPHAYRVVFLLRDVQGFSVAETAEMLAISVPNVKVRLFRARFNLREQLSEHFERGKNAIELPSSLKRVVSELRAQAAAL